jgi:CheY-like chemotaxis protein
LVSALTGCYVLVAEDEYVLAEDLCLSLSELGAVVIGPFASLAEVCNAVENEPRLDAAVLDINLRGELVYPAADRLRVCGTPFIFATAYGPDTIAERFKDVPQALKPLGAKRALALLKALPGLGRLPKDAATRALAG